jgi:hypothetical protein
MAIERTISGDVNSVLMQRLQDLYTRQMNILTQATEIQGEQNRRERIAALREQMVQAQTALTLCFEEELQRIFPGIAHELTGDDLGGSAVSRSVSYTFTGGSSPGKEGDKEG